MLQSEQWVIPDSYMYPEIMLCTEICFQYQKFAYKSFHSFPPYPFFLTSEIFYYHNVKPVELVTFIDLLESIQKSPVDSNLPVLFIPELKQIFWTSKILSIIIIERE